MDNDATNDLHQSPNPDRFHQSDADQELWAAVMANDQRRVSTWLARGADVNARDREGRTPLFKMVSWGNDTAVAKTLLAHGADVHARDKAGMTPLHTAAAFGDEVHMRVLLDHGAAIDARSGASRTPLHCATILGRFEEAMFLVSQGADVHLRDKNGQRPLQLLAPHVEEHLREPFARLLSGFMTAKVVEARPDSLIMRVESLYSTFTEAERQASERGTLTVPCGIFPQSHHPRDLVCCKRGLTPGLDEAWQQEHRRTDLGIERHR